MIMETYRIMGAINKNNALDTFIIFLYTFDDVLVYLVGFV